MRGKLQAPICCIAIVQKKALSYKLNNNSKQNESTCCCELTVFFLFDLTEKVQSISRALRFIFWSFILTRAATDTSILSYDKVCIVQRSWPWKMNCRDLCEQF